MSAELAERWLRDFAIEAESRIFEPAKLEVPADLRYRVGAVPGTRGTSRKTLGMYVPARMCADGMPQIYVSPLIGAAEAKRVGATLVHEMVHAIFPEAGHSGTFGAAARAVGLVGPLTATEAGSDLAAILDDIVADLGDYPHGAIDPKARKSQSTRMLKATCPDCDVAGRFSAKHIDAAAHVCRTTGELAPLVREDV